jgi:cell division septation protein DedD
MVWRGNRSESTDQLEPDVEREPLHPDDEPDEYADRSIFATGWFRALLVLAGLAVAVVAMLPYVLDWLEPAASPVRPAVQARSSPPPATPLPSQPTAPLPESAPSASENVAVPPPAPIVPPRTVRAPAPEKAPRALPVVGTGTVDRRPPRDEAVSRPNGNYWVQLGVFKDSGNAERLAKKVRGEGFSVQVASVTRSEDGTPARGVTGTAHYVVRAGAFADRTRAIAARDDLKARGHAAFVSEGTAQ